MKFLNNKKILSLISAFLLLLTISSCSSVPITGRQRIALLPASNLSTMALQSYNSLLKQSKLSTNSNDVNLVNKVGNRIALAAEQFMKEEGLGDQLKHYKWEFNLIEDPKTINAFCMPGGKVAVYTGILPIAQDEAGLAVIMGHEVAHAIARHGNERMSQGLMVQLGGIALEVAIQKKPEETKNLFRMAYGIGAQLGVLLPYSRTHESEADHIGLILMTRAGYNPDTAPIFWQRMSKIGKGQRPPQFISTHPSPQKRVRQLKTLIPKVKKRYYKK